MTRHFITVEWCGSGRRGIFCRQNGTAVAKDNEPYTTEEIDNFLGPFTLILSPQSQQMNEADLAHYNCFVPLEEYSNEWGIAFAAEDWGLNSEVLAQS